jgi:nitrite reductase (NADH) small subunit
MSSSPTAEAASTWHLACRVEDVPDDGGDNLCPHKQQMALSRGMIGCQDGEPKVACPFHKKSFSLQTGACLSGEEYGIQTYSVRIEGGQVFLLLPP